MLHSAITWLLGTVPALAKAMRAVSTLLKLRDCALAANAGMPGSSSHAFSSASVTADGFFGSRFFFRYSTNWSVLALWKAWSSNQPRRNGSKVSRPKRCSRNSRNHEPLT
ncbi:hypothetical protein D3C72_1648920 [compost metagenome]